MDESVDRFASFKQDVCDANADVPSTFVRDLGFLYYLINSLSRDQSVVARLNTEVNEAPDELQTTEESLFSRFRYLA